MEYLTGLDFFQPEGASVAALLTLRLSGLIWIAPIFSSRALPPKTKTAFLILFVILLWPSATSYGYGASFTMVSVLSELLIGLGLGLGAAIFVAAAESAGDMLAVQMGLSGANVVDPMSATQLPVLGQFLGLFVMALILSSGGHVVILSALSASLELLPIGGVIPFEEGVQATVALGSKLLLMGLRMAGPVIAAMMVGNAALGVLARTTPQLNVLMVAFPVQIAIGLMVLGATLPLIATQYASWNADYIDVARELMRPLIASGGGR